MSTTSGTELGSGARADAARPEPRIAALQEAVLAWWPGVRPLRDELPWRCVRDPWQVLVSETMLAQTQVLRVAERFPAFVEAFPTPRSCAAASLAEVLRAWSGLGYYRRARALHSAATTIVDEHGGAVPADLGALLALPGVGPYTARAVLAFAFGADVAALDTNVARVIARAVAGRPLRRSAAQQLADSLVPRTGGREWNLALMDFGATVCRARAPRCGECVLAAGRQCCWWSDGGSPPDPAAGSAAVSTAQKPYAGSDRQGRGALLRVACAGPIARSHLADAAGWPEDSGRAERVGAALVAEGLLAEGPGGTLVLPG